MLVVLGRDVGHLEAVLLDHIMPSVLLSVLVVNLLVCCDSVLEGLVEAVTNVVTDVGHHKRVIVLSLAACGSSGKLILIVVVKDLSRVGRLL